MFVDLKTDPGEMINLALEPQSGELLEMHREWLRKWYAESHETLGSEFLVP
jgi:hypothetical protein